MTYSRSIEQLARGRVVLWAAFVVFYALHVLRSRNSNRKQAVKGEECNGDNSNKKEITAKPS